MLVPFMECGFPAFLYKAFKACKNCRKSTGKNLCNFKKCPLMKESALMNGAPCRVVYKSEVLSCVGYHTDLPKNIYSALD